MRQPVSIRRVSLAASLCILGGAAATVLVAWGFGLWGTVGVDARFQGNLQMSESGPFIAEFRFIGPGLRDEIVETSSATPVYRRWVTRHHAGWPVCAFLSSKDVMDETGFEFDPAIVPTPQITVRILEPGLQPPAWLTRSAYDRSGYLVRPPLPLRMLPRGFVLDTLFYAALLAATLIAQPRLRRTLRLRRGLCPGCGYNLAGNTTGICPECGASTVAR